jgi:LacI family transcriptional regulator
MKKKPPTVVDVARLAGVGPSTVSRYLRNVNISERTAEKVEKAIRVTGYEPDVNARALRLGKTKSIGVVLPKVSNTFFSTAVQLLEERVREYGYTMMLVTHQDRPDDQIKQLGTLRRSRVDGVLITAVPGTDLKDVRKTLGEVPLVAFDSVFSTAIDGVVLHNRETARLATEHLLAHGYKKVAAVTAKPEIYSFRERLYGFEDTLKQRSLPAQMILGSDYDELRHLLRNVLKGTKRPDALLTLSDFATHNVIRIFDELHYQPSDWIPLIGFDDFSYAPLLAVPITVMRQPIDELIRTSFSLLFKRIEDNTTAERQIIQIPGELIRRRSCGCA